MRRSVLLVGILGILALLVGACAGDDDEDDVASSAPAAAQSQTTTPTSGTQATTTESSATTAMAEMPVYGGVWRTASSRDVRSGFDPHGTRGGQSQHMNSNTLWYNNLVAPPHTADVTGGSNAPFPDLAESWEVSGDGLTFTFHLNQGVKFHDRPPVNGREVTAEDVKWSMERFLAGPDSFRWMLQDIKSIEVVDKYTIRIQIKEWVASFMVHMTAPLGLVTAKESATSPPQNPGLDLPEEFIAPDGMIGTGPFMIDEYTKGSKLSVIRNPNYFKKDDQGNQLPYLDGYEYVVIGDSNAREAAFVAGQLETGGPAGTNITDFKNKNPQIQHWQEVPDYSAPAINFRLDRSGPLQDIRVRRAIAMGLDQDAFIATRIGSRTSRTWGGITGTAVPELDVTVADAQKKLGDASQWWLYNPKGSMELLADAGYSGGLELTYQLSSCCLTTYFPELVADQLSKVGIKVNIQIVDHSVHLRTSNVGKGDYDMAHSRLHGMEVDDLLLTYLPGNTKNNSHVDDPVLSKMVLAQRLIQDPKQRFAAIEEIQRYLAGQAYVWLIPYKFNDSFAQAWVKNYRPHGGRSIGRDLERAWIDPALKN